MTANLATALPAADARRSHAGILRFTGRDIAGLVLAGDMYAAPYQQRRARPQTRHQEKGSRSP
jgi:hypothetical protein